LFEHYVKSSVIDSLKRDIIDVLLAHLRKEDFDRMEGLDRNLWHAFVRTARNYPDRAALIKGTDINTFAELHARAIDYYVWYGRVGVRRHDRVILWMENSGDMAAALFGLWAAGAIPVLLHSEAPLAHITHAIDVVQPRVLLHAPDQEPPHDGLFVRMASTADVQTQADAPAPNVDTWLTEPASILFTSGSTGRPKGVTQSHGNLLVGCHTVGAYLGLRGDDRVLCPVPWSFDYGYGQLLSTAILGVTSVLPTKPNPSSICEAIELHRPSVLAGLPSLLAYLIRGVSPLPDTDLSSFRMLTNSGGQIPKPILTDLRAYFQHCQIFLNYGLTETYRSAFLAPSLVDRRSDSLGKPMPGVDMIVVRDDGSVADPDEIGELVHRGNCVFMGYWGDPQATAKALRQDPLAPSGCPEVRRTLFTGDLGWRSEDGFLYFKGRADHQLKSMGVRVSPGDIEDLLYESGLLLHAAVFGVPHDMIGDEVYAAVVPIAGIDNVTRRLANHARTVMSPHMMPRRYLVKDELPRTHSGKIDYVRLKSEGLSLSTGSLSGR
jgi:acyl-coenzyme A synthetase/AMP-(fatty) acid ligase